MTTTTKERRHHPRVAVGKPARLRPHERFVMQVDVVDCSPQGFRAYCEAAVRIGNWVSLDVPGLGVVEAKVIWRKDGQIGAQFVRPIDLEHCAWTNPAVAKGLVAEADGSEPATLLARQLAERAARSMPAGETVEPLDWSIGQDEAPAP
jgi:hypothetical protein